MNPFAWKIRLELLSLALGILGVTYRLWWPPLKCLLLKITAPFRNIGNALLELPTTNQRIGTIASGFEEVKTAVMVLQATAKVRADRDPSIGMFELATDGRMVYCADTVRSWLNVSRGELLDWGWVSLIHADYREDLLADLRDCLAMRRSFAHRCPFNTSDGRELWVDMSAKPIPTDGPVLQWVGSMRRVSAAVLDEAA